MTLSEIPESMYPQETDKLKFVKHSFIWQVKHIGGTQIFVVGRSRGDMEKEVAKIFNIMNLDIFKGGDYQARRLPICEVKNNKWLYPGF